MGLLDDLDQLVGSQKHRAASTLQRTVSKPKSRPVQSAKAPKPDSSENTGAYSTWTLSQLQDEVKKYGFRPSNDRKALLKQLKEVKEALERQKEEHQQQQQQDDDESALGDTSMVSSSSFVCPSSSMDEEVSMSDLTMEMIRQAREPDIAVAKVGARSDDDEASENAEEEEKDDESDKEAARLEAVTTSPTAIAPSLSSQLHKAITSDKALYHRILLFEPVSFDEISSTAKRAGVTGLRNKETLRNWLDMQGICFYSAELSGSRHRY